jgi:hypothetical protein
MKRRDFVRNMGLLAAAGGFGSMLLESCNDRLNLYTIPNRSLDIAELNFRVRLRSWEDNQKFWTQFMQLVPEPAPQGQFGYKVGTTTIFNRLSNLPPNQEDVFFPQYHYSIGIPSNQIENCLDWITKRNEEIEIYNSGLGPNEQDLKIPQAEIWKDADTGAEIVRRDLYNSLSIFLKDPAGNIIEILARTDADNPEDQVTGDFSPSMFRGITEVGVVANDVRKVADTIKNTFQVQEVDGSSNSYKPIGGPKGLLKLTVPGRVWFPTPDERSVAHDLIITVHHTEVITPIKLSLYGDTVNFTTGVWLKSI